MQEKGFQIRMFICHVNELDSLKEYLEKKAANGWMLEKREGMICYFKRCEPKEVRFSVEIFKRVSDYTMSYEEANVMYIDLCEAAGWHFVCADGQVQILYTEDKSVIPIETDAKLKLETIHNSIRRDKLFGWIIMGCLGPFILYSRFHNGMVEILSNYMEFSLVFLWLLIPSINLCQAILYFSWYYRMRRKIENGEDFSYSKNKGNKIIFTIAFLFVIIWFIGTLVTFAITGDSSVIFFGSIYIAIPLTIVCIQILKILIQKNGIKKIFGQSCHYLGSAILFLAVANAIVLVLTGGMYLGIWNENAETVTYKDIVGEVVTETKYNDTLPLTLEDLGIEIIGDYDTCAETDDSFIINRDHYYQTPMDNNYQEDDLQYSIYRINNNWIYDTVLKEEYTEYDYHEVKMPQFQANKVYYSEEGYNTYLLLYDNMILNLQTTFKLNDFQIATVVERLVKTN